MHAEATMWKPPRRWLVIKEIDFWGLAAIVIVWPLTLLGGITAISPGGYRAALYGGSINLGHLNPPDPNYPPGLYTYANAGALWLVPGYHAFAAPGSPSRVDFIMPLWLLVIPLACAAAAGVMRCRPSREGLCSGCDYDLRGIPEAERCPECGRLVRDDGTVRALAPRASQTEVR